MVLTLLIALGLIIGSFLNVIILRYQGSQKMMAPSIIGGRSACMTCRVQLRWYELVPLFSFLVQGARCRHCKHALNWQYPIVEGLTALATVVLPLHLYTFYGAAQALAQGFSGAWFFLAIAVWLIIAYTTIVLSAIDVRLRIIPDQSNVLLGICAIILGMLKLSGTIPTSAFTGPYSEVLGGSANVVLNMLGGGLFALALFGGTILLTRGRGMGLGDLKLAIPLGLILGWPDMLVATIAAFVLGSIVGLLLIADKRATMGGAIPFGPFIVLGFYVAIFYGESILRWYFTLI
jgi:leader peptidase (prepilin peptidase)/N-methyltransferase